MSDFIDLNPDPNEDLADLLRETGAWCDVHKDYSGSHYFLARNKKLEMAVSLCGKYVLSFDKLIRVEPVKRCLVCDLFANSREEVYKAVADLRTKQDWKPKRRKGYRQDSLF